MLTDYKFKAKAALSGYLVMGGMWLGIAAFMAIIGYAKQEPSLIAPTIIFLCVSAAWMTWLSGFQIQMTDKCLLYRDGFRKKTCVNIIEINDVQNKWVEWSNLGRRMTIPRLVVIHQNGEILINTKPFSRESIKEISVILKGHVHARK